MIDWTKPETFKLSDDAYDRYRNDNDRLHNSVARENSEQSMLAAMRTFDEDYEKIAIDGKGISTFIRDL
jgi:hypothetical protein